MIAGTNTLVPPGSPELAGQDLVDPNKPRLVLAPIDETEVALAAFFNAVESRRDTDFSELRRVYRPFVPLATFASPDEIYNFERRADSYRHLDYAAQDFLMIRGRNRVVLRRPHLNAVAYDGGTVIAAHFDDPKQVWQFGRVRERFTDDAEAAIRLQVEDRPHIPIVKEHTPDVVLPIGRTYRFDQVHKVIRGLNGLFETLFPDELELQPYLAPPSIKKADASFKQSERKRRRAQRLMDLRARYETPGHEHVPLLERAIAAAENYPHAQVVYYGVASAVVAAAQNRLPNLTLQSVEREQSFLSISHG